MQLFKSAVHKIGNNVMIVAAIFLMATMTLTVGNVILRAFGRVFAGTYELTEVLIVVVAACALGYAALEKTHVIVDVFVSRFSKRVQGIIDSITSLLGLSLWGTIAWMSIKLMLQRWSDERTELLHVSYAPFRVLWVCGMIFICLVLVTDIVSGLRKGGKM